MSGEREGAVGVAYLGCSRRVVVAGWLLSCVTACARPEPRRETAASASVELELPVFSSRASERVTPEWMASLPEERPKVAPGTKVWTTLLQAGGELAEVAVVRVDAASETAVSVIDKTGQRIDGVPSALVHPVGDTRNLREGTLALFYTFTTPGFLGRVSHSVHGEELRVKYDWAGQTKETPVDHAEPLRRGLVPLAFVAFPKGGATSMGQVVALDAKRAWLRTESGHVDVVGRSEVTPLDLQDRDFAVGQEVRAYRWAVGFERGTVSRVVEPGLRYEVAFGPKRAPFEYFITALVAP